MRIIDNVSQHLSKMSKSEQAVAEFFCDHMQDFALYTLDHMANSIGVSTTSVIRFCRKLGFTGYKDFQTQLRSEVNVQLTLPEQFQMLGTLPDSNSLLQQTLQDGLSNVERTFAELSIQTLDDAVQRIHKAKRVFTFGMRESLALAHYTYTRLATARGGTQILDVGYNGMVEQTLDLNSDDVVICYLFHRYTAQSRHILPFIKTQGATLILITSAPYTSLEKHADIILPCHVSTHGVKNTSLAPICLADYFCNAVALLNKDSTDQRMQTVEQILQAARVLG